jgi:hypothetical protein
MLATKIKVWQNIKDKGIKTSCIERNIHAEKYPLSKLLKQGTFQIVQA